MPVLSAVVGLLKTVQLRSASPVLPVSSGLSNGTDAMLSCMQDMSVVPGVRIEDMGHKMGCNGVDNGKLWFDGAHTSCLHAVARHRMLH